MKGRGERAGLPIVKRIVMMLMAVLLALLVVEAAIASGMPDCMGGSVITSEAPMAHPCHQMPDHPQAPKACPMAAFCLAMAGCGLVALAPAAPAFAAFSAEAAYAPRPATGGVSLVGAPPLEPPRAPV